LALFGIGLSWTFGRSLKPKTKFDSLGLKADNEGEEESEEDAKKFGDAFIMQSFFFALLLLLFSRKLAVSCC
jgi:hypothetical protein